MKILSAIFLFACGTVVAQEIDYRYHLHFRDKKLFIVDFENDFFLATDRYYSQGISFAYKNPLLSEHKLTQLFLGKGKKVIGLGIDQMGFTPKTIAYDSLLTDDRPYAATLRGNILFETIDSARNNSIGWGVSLGIIGSEALGKEMQTEVHHLTNNEHPKGWRYQINTGLLLDANIFAQQRLLSQGNWFILVAEESAWAGTSRINVTGGTRMQVQYLTKNRNFTVGAYANPAITLVGYDGTLQGSMIAEKSVYVVRAADVKRVIFEREFGIFVRAKNIELNSVLNINTNYFRGANLERWGVLRAKFYF